MFVQRKGSAIPIRVAKTEMVRPGFLEKRSSSRVRPVNVKRALSFPEVKALSEEFLLPIKSIYDLNSAFNGLTEIAKDQAK